MDKDMIYKGCSVKDHHKFLIHNVEALLLQVHIYPAKDLEIVSHTLVHMTENEMKKSSSIFNLENRYLLSRK